MVERAGLSIGLVRQILYGSPGGRRFTQDSPVLPEVWVEYARNAANGHVSGLIVPRKGNQAHHVADELHARVRAWRDRTKVSGDRSGAAISDIPGLVLADMHFDEMVNLVLPLTRWWSTDGMEKLLERVKEEHLAALVTDVHAQLKGMDSDSFRRATFDLSGFDFLGLKEPTPDATLRILVLIGMIQASRNQTENMTTPISELDGIPSRAVGQAAAAILDLEYLRNVTEMQTPHFNALDSARRGRLIFTLNLNRTAKPGSMDSVRTMKADAAYRLFNISTKDITWAIIDSGVDATHPAFRVDRDTGNSPRRLSEAESRVTCKYDLTLVPRLRNRDLLDDTDAQRAFVEDLEETNEADLARLTDLVRDMFLDLKTGRPFNWETAEPLLRVRHDVMPEFDHGTHVAGILGGVWEEHDDAGIEREITGMCPDIKMIDFKVIDDDKKITEYAVIAAQRLIRHLNDRDDFLSIQGANISLSIPHDVSNYACGRTPVCAEAETLVNNGVVVVCAAGNDGHNTFMTSDGDKALHTTTSITDPGNAEAVITVGATHRLEPHTYGVSYFSSRGPTGDGRMKPDLVAPGEKIRAPIRAGQFGVLEGTSMAAPHVSGAAAMLMARFEEFKGRPQRIKAILRDSATDLGRERAFQGAGILDVLRALQSV